MRQPTIPPHRCLVVALVLATWGCESTTPDATLPPSFGKGGVVSLDPIVEAVDPDSTGRDTTLTIRVTGAGFDRGSTVEFALGGIPSSQLQVNQVSYVSSRALDVSLSVPADAKFGRYDVAVTTSTGKKGVGSELFAIVWVDVSVAIQVPLDDAGLSIRSDHNPAYSAAGISVYEDGACRVSGILHLSVTGDATLKTDLPNGKNCGRRFVLGYPDGITETLPSFLNLARLHGPDAVIPVGAVVRRHMNFAPASINKNPSRCGVLHFGVGKLGNGVGSDSLNVHRSGPSTWHVYSEPGHNLALCRDTGELLPLTVDFTIVALVPLSQ